MSTSQVEKLVEYRKDDRRYRVRWSGYASEDDSWVVPRDIDEPADLFKKFWTEKIQNEGRSTLLELPFEQFLVQRVRVQLAGNLSPSTSEILLTIKNEANNFRHLPGWPTYLSTSEDCAKFIMQHPGYEDILTIVHQQEAYAWFCEYFTLPIETLYEYLLPVPGFYSLPRIGVSRKKLNTSSMGTYPTGTHAFEPDLLNPSRIPLRVDAHDFRPCISDHFKEILFQTPAAKSQIRSVAKSDFLTLARRCGKHKLGTEASVRELSREISGVVDSIYFDLTQKSLETSTEPSEEGKQVRTDRVYSCLDKVLLLWDEKSPAAFNHHVSSLQVHLPLKFNIFQGRWENEEAILAKIVWHSSSLDEKPRWAILFGGEDYLLILIVYVKDSHGLDRPFLFCSPIHSIYDAGLPIFSVSIYMALTANIPEDDLLQKLGIQRPTAPEPVLDPLPKTYAEATTTQISKLDVLHLVLDEPVSYRKLVRIEQALTEPDGEGQKPRMNYAIFLDSKCERMEGSTGTTYISKCRSFAVKLSHQTRNARKALTDEWETYIKLKTQKGQATMYGLFEIDAGTTEDGKRKEGLRYVLVMSYEGESPCSFSVLSDAERRQIFSKLKQYHADGLLHGDFAPRNVVCKRGGTPVIIDFSHSSWDHMCRGEFSCGELLEARKQLWGSTPGDPPSPPPPQSVMRHLGNNEPQSLVFQKI